MSGTETFDPRYRGLDTWPDEAILSAFLDAQARSLDAVRDALGTLAAAARAVAERIEPDGRLVYAGAGSSGRQAALDGMELGATFGWPAERIAFVLAEGNVLHPDAKSADEDDSNHAEELVQTLELRTRDCMITVAASGTTPFTVSAAKAAKAAGALVIAIANNARAPLFQHADHAILLDTGPEVIAGSTRMSAGTAHKAALGLLSSLAMTRLGHVHDGFMVSMRSDCSKLEDRATRIVAEIAACAPNEASAALAEAGGRIKPAVLVALGTTPERAASLLAQAAGNLRIALGLLHSPD
jgi:N-acetylmuramic acid 6-phosphate etherase